MIDLRPVFKKEKTLAEVCAHLTQNDLRNETNQMIDTYQDIIKDCTDANVVFAPVDPDAQDDAAASEEEKNIAWTLGHVIVHTTAGSEEGAFLAAELARGVENHGRSRYETPWETVTTIQQVRDRLEESRRMRLASIDSWPDKPHLDNKEHLGFMDDDANCYGRFIVGLAHENLHIEQTKEIVRQAKAG
ncbi:MAG: DinB family protein [Chloroflexota bacterium]